MESMFQSLLHRIAKLPAKLTKLFDHSPATSSSSPRISQIVEDLEQLHRRMERIRALLDDAESRQLANSRIGLWLKQLRAVSYETEDVIEELEYKLLRHELAVCEEEEKVPVTQRTRVIEMKDDQIGAKIKKVNDLFEEIYVDGRELDLLIRGRNTAGPWDPPLRTEAEHEVEVWGREAEMRRVLHNLLSDVDVDGSNGDFRIVCIVGMGGVGKTTLAQMVYHDSHVVNHFDRMVWVCVSRNFGVTRLIKEMLRQVGGSSPSEDEGCDYFLQETLCKRLEGNRFLVVLDDVWDTNQRFWEALWLLLLIGAKGSRILITTRSEKVSKICGGSSANMCTLDCLSDHDSWSLFKRIAFAGSDASEDPTLTKIGRRIVRKCRGHPLTVKTLAGLLFDDLNAQRWNHILHSELWELAYGINNILPVLILGYHCLPWPMKPCFAYCAFFPEDHEYERDELVLLWMAQGYINMESTAGKLMEEVAEEYLHHLQRRSLLEYAGDGDRFKMHDLFHDVALHVSDGDCLTVADPDLFIKTHLSTNIRHLYWFEGDTEHTAQNLLSCRSADHKLRFLRSFYMDSQRRSSSALTSDVLHNVFLYMKYLRVLDLRTVDIRELPTSVGELKFLRYLRISGRNLLQLPESLGDLLFLQTLEVTGAHSLEKLLRCLKKLVNLRYLILHKF